MTCRCNDLRRALLCLVRRCKERTDAKFDDLALGIKPGDPESLYTETHPRTARAMRRARRLLRETRRTPGQSQPITSSDPLVALRLLIAATKRYRKAGTAVSLVMGENAFLDRGDNPAFTAALEEDGEASRVLREALAVAERTISKAQTGFIAPPCHHCQEEGSRTTRRSPRIFLRQEVVGTIMCEAHHWRAAPVGGTTCRIDESDVPFAMEPAGRSASEALDRIVEAWKAYDTPEPDSDGSRGVNLMNTLRSVAREFGYAGGEDGTK